MGFGLWFASGAMNNINAERDRKAEEAREHRRFLYQQAQGFGQEYIKEKKKAAELASRVDGLKDHFDGDSAAAWKFLNATGGDPQSLPEYIAAYKRNKSARQQGQLTQALQSVQGANPVGQQMQNLGVGGQQPVNAMQQQQNMEAGPGQPQAAQQPVQQADFEILDPGVEEPGGNQRSDYEVLAVEGDLNQANQAYPMQQPQQVQPPAPVPQEPEQESMGIGGALMQSIGRSINGFVDYDGMEQDVMGSAAKMYGAKDTDEFRTFSAHDQFKDMGAGEQSFTFNPAFDPIYETVQKRFEEAGSRNQEEYLVNIARAIETGDEQYLFAAMRTLYSDDELRGMKLADALAVKRAEVEAENTFTDSELRAHDNDISGTATEIAKGYDSVTHREYKDALGGEIAKIAQRLFREGASKGTFRPGSTIPAKNLIDLASIEWSVGMIEKHGEAAALGMMPSDLYDKGRTLHRRMSQQQQPQEGGDTTVPDTNQGTNVPNVYVPPSERVSADLEGLLDWLATNKKDAGYIRGQ